MDNLPNIDLVKAALSAGHEFAQHVKSIEKNPYDHVWSISADLFGKSIYPDRWGVLACVAALWMIANADLNDKESWTDGKKIKL